MSDGKYSAAEVAAVAMQSKNMVLGLLLTFFFGSIGLFYTSIGLGIIGLIVELMIWFFALVTFGFGAVLVIPWHLFSMILVAIMISNHNRRLLNSLR